MQTETMEALDRIPKGTVSRQSMSLGINENEPLFYALDGLLRYAKAYRKRYESPLADDGVLGPYFAEAVAGLRGLLNGDGAVALERNITTDSKDNGACDAIACAALEVAGYEA